MAKYKRYAVELNSEPVEDPDEGSKNQHDRRVVQELNADQSQIDRFKKLARELGCYEDEAAFDAALKKLADVEPLPKHEPKKRTPSDRS